MDFKNRIQGKLLQKWWFKGDNKMKKEPVLFEFDSAEVRVIKNENGDPWFVARDVCCILDIKNVSQALDNLDDDEKLIYKIHISGQIRDVLCVTESGLYALIIRSNKPKAREFRKWITSEVLPQIRKTGTYTIDNQSSIPYYLSIIEDLEKQLKEAEPKVEAYDSFMDAGDGVSLTIAAQQIGVKPAQFFNFLINNGYCRDSNNWDYRPYQKYINAGYFTSRICGAFTQTLVLPKGIVYFGRQSIKEKIEKESKERRYSQPKKTISSSIKSIVKDIISSFYN